MILLNLPKLSTSTMIQAWQYRVSSENRMGEDILCQQWGLWAVKFTYMYSYNAWQVCIDMVNYLIWSVIKND